MQQGKWKGIRLSRYGPLLTHLFFADDLVLFAEASQEQINIIKTCLEKFSRASGQRINLKKSQIFFSKNVNTAEAQRIATLANIPPTINLGKYLGVPSIHGRLTNSLFTPILDKIDARLNGWKMRYLTLAGRHILAQSILHTIPYFSMQTMFMPAGIWEAIDKRIRRFIWGGTPEQRKCHLIRWDTVTKPKEAGGLGIRATKEVNLAFMAKLGWRILVDRDSLWVRIMRAKYAHGKHGVEIMTSKQGGSNAWKGITSAFPLIHEKIRFTVNNGRDTRFWMDSWIQDKPLQDTLGNQNLHVTSNAKVNDLWDINRGWKWEELPNIPENIRQRLEVKIVADGEVGDEISWASTASGIFSINSAYNLIKGQETNMQEQTWSKIWKLKIPSKMKTFLWIARHDRVMGNAERKRRGLTVEGDCNICPGKEESTEHILRDCKRAKEVWKAVAGRDRAHRWNHHNLTTWLEHNINEHTRVEENNEWPRTFAITTWWIWKWRNDRVFNTREMDIQSKHAWIKEAEDEACRAFMREENMKGTTITQRMRRLCWKPSTNHRYTINVDGSVKHFTMKAGLGGILRDKNGEWREGFSGKADFGDPTAVEAKAIVKSMEWAWEKGYRDVEFQSDATTVIEWIHTKANLRGPIREIIEKAHQWIDRDWKISIKAIYREQNRVADALASVGARQSDDWSIYDTSPFGCEEAYLDDLLHITSVRRVRENN